MRELPKAANRIREFRTDLAGFVGKFVRIYTLDGCIHQGTLVSVPDLYMGIGDDGGLSVRGNYVLDGAPRHVGKIENIATYDVLPRRRSVNADRKQFA
jgi:hypothetical protein